MAEPCMQENRITRIENKVDKLVDVVADVAVSIKTLANKMDSMVDTVAENERTLKGSNGNTGIVAKVVQSVDLIDELNEAMRGEKDKPGLIAIISEMNRKIGSWEESMTWLKRAVIGIVIAAGAGLVSLIIRIYPLLQAMGQ